MHGLLPRWRARWRCRRSRRHASSPSRTDLEIEISNQCARLVANAIVFYNSAILSRLLEKYEASGNEKALSVVTSTSPVAWRHVHLNGRYAFRDVGQAIDLDTLIKGLMLE